MNAFVTWVLANLAGYGVPALLVICYLGSLGIPFPITPVIIAAGAFTRAGLFDWRLALLACLAGAALADHSEYLLGRVAQPWLERHLGQKLLWRQAQATMRRQGNWAILFTRFWFTPLAPAVNLIAGSRYPYVRFLVFDLVGELLWVLLYGGMGYLFAAQWEQASQTMSLLSGLSMALVILVLGLVWYAQRRRQPTAVISGAGSAVSASIREINHPAAEFEYHRSNHNGTRMKNITPHRRRPMNETLHLTTTTSLQPLVQYWVLPPCGSQMGTWQALADGFTPISLAEMDGVALLNRLDTKFVMSTSQLWITLASLQQEYWMLEVNGQRLNRYRTMYFDTPSFDLYLAHVNERPERYKVRSREYADSHLAFLEVKHRTRKDRTIKERIPIAEQWMRMPPELQRWLRSVSPVDGSALEPKLWNSFIRMTLVSKHCCERVTLDLALSFSNDARRLSMDEIVIAEVKMDAVGGVSPFLAQMRSQRIRQRGFSKYAMGVALLYTQVKKNTLKPRLLWLEKMMKGSVSHASAW